MADTSIPLDWLVEEIQTCQNSGTRVRRRAWARLAERLWPALLRIAISEQRRSWFGYRSWDMAEDAAIHAFTALFEKINTISDPRGLQGWLRIVIRNYFRSAGSHGFYAREAATGEMWPFETQPHYDSSKVLSVVQRLHEALRGLPLDERHIIYLRFWEELSPTEIGQLYGITRQGMAKRITRICGDLRNELLSAGYDRDAWADTSLG